MQDQVQAIQQLFPQVYHACHVQHTRRRSNAFRLSERDGAILAHIGPGYLETARDLTRHLGIGAPTLSAALARLERLGLVERERRERAGGTRRLRLSARGQEAVQATSVLDAERLGAALAGLTATQLAAAVRGLALLARACRQGARREERA